MSNRQRIADLERFAAEEGLRLPMSAATIVALKETGAVVDLLTGAIMPGGAEQRVRLTVVGEANAVANRRWGQA